MEKLSFQYQKKILLIKKHFSCSSKSVNKESIQLKAYVTEVD